MYICTVGVYIKIQYSNKRLEFCKFHINIFYDNYVHNLNYLILLLAMSGFFMLIVFQVLMTIN